MKGTAPSGAAGAASLIQVYDFYAALVESSDDAIVAKDINGVVISWNPAAERLFGYSNEEMCGRSIRCLLPNDRGDEEDLILKRIRGGERVAQYQTQRLHKDGHAVDISVTVSPVRDSAGTIVGASKIARNIGPMLDNQRRLRESEARLRMLADNIAQFAWIADASGKVVWFNKRWFDYTGLDPSQAADERRSSVLPEEYREPVRERYEQAVRDGKPWEDTFPLRRKDGELRWFLSRAQPIRDDDGGTVWWFGTNTDITEQREQAEQIRLLLLEVNHRSKNMLSTIQALARRTNSDEPGVMARFEDRVRSLAVNQDILVERQWREVPLRELVEAQLQFAAAAQGVIDAQGPDLLLRPRASEVVGMALHELATNSLKYGAMSTDGGKVHIRWERGADGFTLTWRESGGPPVQPPQRTGFGTKLILDVPRHNLSARVSLTYPEDGIAWKMDCDDAQLVDARA